MRLGNLTLFCGETIGAERIEARFAREGQSLPARSQLESRAKRTSVAWFIRCSSSQISAGRWPGPRQFCAAAEPAAPNTASAAIACRLRRPDGSKGGGNGAERASE